MKTLLLLGIVFLLMFKQADGAREPGSEFKAAIAKLRSTRTLKIFVVPIGMSFRTRVDATRLKGVACEYSLMNNNKEIRSRLADMLQVYVLDVKELGTAHLDLRIGIYADDQEFLFEDHQGAYDVKGTVGDSLLTAQGGLTMSIIQIVNEDFGLITAKDVRC